MSYGSYPQVPPPYPQPQHPAPFAGAYPYAYAPTAQAAYSLPPATHPPTGVISFVLALLSALAIFLVFVVAVVAGAQRHAAVESNDPSAHASDEVLMGGLFLLSVLLSFVGVGLGVAGLLQSGRRRVFPLTGLIVNLLVLGFLIVMMLAGLAVAGNR